MRSTDGLGFLAFILGGVAVIVLTLAVIAFRAQSDHMRKAELDPPISAIAKAPRPMAR